MSTITKLTPIHVVINNADKANDPTAMANSKKLYNVLANAEEAYTAHCNQSPKPTHAANDLYIRQNILPSILTQVGQGQTFVLYKKDKKTGNEFFEVLPTDKKVLSELKAKLRTIRSVRERSKKKAGRVEEREILEEEPAKTIEKKPEGQSNEDTEKIRRLRDQMIAVNAEYYAANGSRESRLEIVNQIISSIQGEGYVFVQRVNGQLTKLTEEEVVDWIRTMFHQNKQTWVGRTSNEIERTRTNKCANFANGNGRDMFTSSDDKEINTFISDMEKAGWNKDTIPLSEWEKFGGRIGKGARAIKQRVRLNLKETEDGLVTVEKTEWSIEQDQIVEQAKHLWDNTGVEPDWNALSVQVGHSNGATRHRMGSVAITQSGERITARDAILGDPTLAKQYHAEAELKPAALLPEKARVMGCIDHGYGSKDYTAKTTNIVPGLKGGKGPELHVAAATISSGKRSLESYSIKGGKKKKMSMYDASHLCKRPCCINPQHLTFELKKANIRRNSCIGRIRLKIGNKIIMGDTNECSCVPRCLDYAEVAI